MFRSSLTRLIKTDLAVAMWLFCLLTAGRFVAEQIPPLWFPLLIASRLSLSWPSRGAGGPRLGCRDLPPCGRRLRGQLPQYSGGERQRVAIARAIVKKPALILADEPTGNLDTERGMEIIGLIKRISQEENTTAVQVTHNMEAAQVSDVVFTLRDGTIVDQQTLRA